MWTTTKHEMTEALDELADIIKNSDLYVNNDLIKVIFEQVGKLRSLVNHLPVDLNGK